MHSGARVVLKGKGGREVVARTQIGLVDPCNSVTATCRWRLSLRCTHGAALAFPDPPLDKAVCRGEGEARRRRGVRVFDDAG